MGTFNNKIMAEFNPPRKWVLGRELSYDCPELTQEEILALKNIGVVMDKTKITVPVGFVTDLASVPRAMWWLIAPFDVARSAIIHDLLYKTIRQYRHNMQDKQDDALVKAAKKASDMVFYHGMNDAEPSVPKWKKYSAWKAVDLFGNGSIVPTEDNI